MSFDWMKIAGYCEDTTTEEKLALLETKEEETPDPSPVEPETDHMVNDKAMR